MHLMKKVYIYKKACRRRSLDAKKLCTYFSKNNYEIVNKPKDADIIIFLGCAAIDATAEISFNKIKEFQNKYDAELIVGGCVPTIEKEKLAEIFNGKTIPTKNLEKIDILFPENKVKFEDIADANILFENIDESKLSGIAKKVFRKIRIIGNTYVGIKNHVIKNLFGKQSLSYLSVTLNEELSRKLFHIRISWGCTGNCTYCKIKESTGPFHSKPFDQCIREFKRGLDEGYKKFVITAVDTGAYGLDNGSSFPELLDKMTKISGDYEIEIRDLNPLWVVKYIDELERLLKRGKIVSIDSTIQAGSHRVLKLMNRYSNTEKMKKAFQRLKKANPGLSLSTDYIIGFPTETRDECRETLDFIKECNFNVGHIFPFACKTDTKAEEIEPKIPKAEILKRLKYTKKFLKKAGFTVFYISKPFFFIFGKSG